MKTVVIGAGLAGLSAAHHLKKDWTILEKASKVGGLAATDVVKGFSFDKTGHLLHMHNPYTKGWLIENLLKDKLAVLQRDSWIYSKKVFTRYPFQANTYGLPKKVVLDCVVRFLEARDRYPKLTEDPSFHQWSNQAFGTAISKHFMLPYNEKLWRHDLKKMTTEWQGKFIPIPSREEVLYGAIVDQKKHFGYNASFYYPKSGGIQILPNSIASGLSQADIHLNTESVEIDIRAKKIYTHQGAFNYDWLINTSPLNVFLSRLKPGLPEPLKKAMKTSMPYTVVYNLNLGISNPKPDTKHWVYFPEKIFPFYRMGICSNFGPDMAPKGNSSFYVEFARKPGEDFDYKGMLARTLSAMRSFGWMRPKDELVVEHWNRIEPAYVVYTHERRAFIQAVMKFLEDNNILSIGRYGAWKYSFMEEAVLDGKKAAERIVELSLLKG